MDLIEALDNQIANDSEEIIHRLFALHSHLDHWIAELRNKGDQGAESGELGRILEETAQLDRLVRQIDATETLVAKTVAQMIRCKEESRCLRWYKDGRVRICSDFIVRSGRTKDLKARRGRILEKVRWQLWHSWEPVDRAAFRPRQ